MNIDDKIWHSETDYYCEVNDFNSSATTKLLPGTEITVYSDSDQSIQSLWFVSATGKFILYSNYSGGGGGGGGGTITVDTAMSDTSTNAVQNKVIKAYTDTKQIKLIPGDNIEIFDDGTISAANTTYTAGENITIDENNVVSATDTKYTAGDNIEISDDNIISATGGSYTPTTEEWTFTLEDATTYTRKVCIVED